jgi:hypothetical protein
MDQMLRTSEFRKYTAAVPLPVVAINRAVWLLKPLKVQRSQGQGQPPPGAYQRQKGLHSHGKKETRGTHVTNGHGTSVPYAALEITLEVKLALTLMIPLPLPSPAIGTSVFGNGKAQLLIYVGYNTAVRNRFTTQPQAGIFKNRKISAWSK